MTDSAIEPRQAFSARVPIPVWEEMERRKEQDHLGDRTALVEAALRKHLFPDGRGQQIPVPDRVADAIETLEQHAPYRLAKGPAAEQGPEAGGGPDSASAPVQAPPRLLVDVVAQRTGLPTALARRVIETGRIEVEGTERTDPSMFLVDVPGLSITLDGSPV